MMDGRGREKLLKMVVRLEVGEREEEEMEAKQEALEQKECKEEETEE
jgi:hypothetical protein